MTENFQLTPRFNPSLQSNINHVQWNCVEQTIKMTVMETPDCAAYAWFSTMNVRQAEAQIDAFSDLEKDALLLVIFHEDKEIGRFKFLNNTLLHHDVFMQNSGILEQPYITLPVHHITIGYKEIISIDKK